MPTLVWNGGFQGVNPVNLEQSVTAKNTCTDIRPILQQSASVNAFLDRYKLSSDNSDSNILKRLQEFRASLEGKVASENRATTGITRDEENSTVTVKKYLDTLESDVRYLRFVNECLTTYSDKPELQSQKDKTEESKIRYESLQTPEERVSYYEGWFPLFRTISETGLFVLFGLSLLFLFYSAALFLRMGGITLDITLPSTVYGNSYGVSMLEGYGPIVVGFVLGLITATYYYFIR
jgi:hypothetical protein